MDRAQDYDVNEQFIDPEEYEEALEDAKEDQIEDDMELTQDLQEGYGAPVPDEKHNQFTFLHKAAFSSDDTIRTTFLSEFELGRPLFTVRFLLDLHKMAMHDGLNKISDYYMSKIQNITNSGMSNRGFAMNLNVTQKKEATKKRMRDISGLKQGKVRREEL